MLKQLFTLGCLMMCLATIAQNDVSPINHDFQADLQYWDYGVWVEKGDKPVVKFRAEAIGYNDNRSVRIRTLSGNYKGDFFDAYLTAALRPLKKGKDYKLEFWVRSDDNKEHSIAFKVYSGTNFKTEFFIQNVYFKGDSKWHRITKTFEASDSTKLFDYNHPILKFGVAGEHGIFYIDDISVNRI